MVTIFIWFFIGLFIGSLVVVNYKRVNLNNLRNKMLEQAKEYVDLNELYQKLLDERKIYFNADVFRLQGEVNDKKRQIELLQAKIQKIMDCCKWGVTNMHKKEILELKAKGYQYKEIAEELGLKPDAVRKACYKWRK